MGFELRNEKLENFEEYEEVDLKDKKQIQISKGWMPHAIDLKVTLGMAISSSSM